MTPTALRWAVTATLLAGAASSVEAAPSSQGEIPRRASPFALSIGGCSPALAEGVRQLLGIEVGVELAREAPPDDACDRLTVSCRGASARVEATAKCGPPVERYVWLDELPADAAPRAIALTGLELREAAKFASAPVREKLALSPAPSATAHTPVAPPASEVPSATLAAAAAWQGFVTPHGASVWGAALLASVRFGRRWLWGGDVSAGAAARRAGDAGDVAAQLVSLGTWFGMEGAAGPFRLHAGLGARLGLARLSGHAADGLAVEGTTVWRPWLGPLVSAGASWRLGRAEVVLVAETGRALLAAKGLADGATAIAIGGTWASVSLGGGLHW